MSRTKEPVKHSTHPHNILQATFILDAFSIESLDVSAKGLLRVLNSDQPLDMNEAVNLCLPRDYDIQVSNIQRERVLSLMSGYWRR